MKYLNKDDLITVIQERLLDESIQLSDDILDKIEQKQLDFVTAYISGRYDISCILTEPPVRDGILVNILSMLVVYFAVKRNAARKVPEDHRDLYKDAIALLDKVQAGRLPLSGIPQITAPGGSTGKLMYGNNTNKDYFI